MYTILKMNSKLVELKLDDIGIIY